MWGLSMKKSTPWPALTVRQTKWESDLWPSEGLFSIFFFFLTKNEKQKQKKPVGRLANWVCKQGLELVLGWVLSSVKNFLSKEVGIYTVLRQQARKVVSEFHHFFIPSPFIKLSSSQYTIFPIKIYCVSLKKRTFSVRVPYNSHIVINLLEAVWL